MTETTPKINQLIRHFDGLRTYWSLATTARRPYLYVRHRQLPAPFWRPDHSNYPSGRPFVTLSDVNNKMSLVPILKKGGRASPKLVYYTDLQEVREYTSTGLILSQHCHTDAGKIHGRTDHILSYHTYRDVHGRNWLIVSTVRRRILLNEKGWGESIPGDTDRV